MNHSESYPRHDSMLSSLSPSSNYQSSPSTVCTTPTQPLRSPIMATSPVGTTILRPHYRDNSTALTYTFEQMVNFIWRQHPSQPRVLVPGGSYTDLTTGQTFTHDQMMAITRPRQLGQSGQSVQHQFQQPSQQQVHASSNGYNIQPRTYQQMMPLQQQHIRQMQQVQPAHIKAQMQQTQGQQWVQCSIPHQQMQPKKHLSYQTSNKRQIVAADQYGHQWTQEQYREMLRRRQLQMVHLSAAVSPLLQQQGQNVPQVSPPMTLSQRSSNNAGRPPTPWPRAELLQRQQMNIQSPQASPHPQSQEQSQLALPVVTSYMQQPVHPAPSECQLVPKQLAEMIRVRQARKNILPPSKSSNGAKAPIPAKPSTQPAAHKQGVRKPQKQPRPQSVLIPAPPKIPEATQTVQQTTISRAKPVPNPETPKSCNSTMAPLIRKTDMPPPPVPKGPNRPSTGVSAPASPKVASLGQSPYPTTSSPRPSTPRTDVDPIEIGFDAAIREELAQYLADCYKYASEETSSQDSVPGGSDSCLGTPQPRTTTNTPTTATITSTSTTPTTPTTTSNPLTLTAPSPILSSPVTPRSPSPSHNILANCPFSLFNNHQELREGGYPGFVDYHDPHAVVIVEEQRDPWRAPEERSMSEERAQLEWDIMVTEGRYAGLGTEEDGEGEECEGME
ncbi:hypothetical protein yc1106_00343 [Curvularia clavata]|uniref:Uncharacterized protein n=1 Tax=Curvularia clavata TaxID=95742 RepID=A0A9Q8Z1G2_CURCL|nr:hypothetical protein yc1106_00343 [Curvularia clavata]